jgi:hypothetical protein
MSRSIELLDPKGQELASEISPFFNCPPLVRFYVFKFPFPVKDLKSRLLLPAVLTLDFIVFSRQTQHRRGTKHALDDTTINPRALRVAHFVFDGNCTVTLG